MPFKTTDLCDSNPGLVRAAAPIFRDFGGKTEFHGPIETIKTFEDNSLVRAALETAGNGRVLIVDGGGSTRCALLGDQLAALGVKNGWQGVIIYGCVRDVVDLRGLDIGIKALSPHPKKSDKRGFGERGVPVTFAGVTFAPGMHVYADEDGVIVADSPLPVA